MVLNTISYKSAANFTLLANENNMGQYLFSMVKAECLNIKRTDFDYQKLFSNVNFPFKSLKPNPYIMT